MKEQLVKAAGGAVIGTCPFWQRRAYTVPKGGWRMCVGLSLPVHDPMGLKFSLLNQMNSKF